MTQHTPSSRWPAYARVPPFLPVTLRARRDGWVPERQALFIGMLAQTGSVAVAARAVGMSRMAAYRLRKSAPEASSFAHAWDTIVTLRTTGEPPSNWKVTPEERPQWALEGPFVITMRRGKFVRVRRKPNDTMLLRWLAQLDRSLVVERYEELA